MGRRRRERSAEGCISARIEREPSRLDKSPTCPTSRRTGRLLPYLKLRCGRCDHEVEYRTNRSRADGPKRSASLSAPRSNAIRSARSVSTPSSTRRATSSWPPPATKSDAAAAVGCFLGRLQTPARPPWRPEKSSPRRRNWPFASWSRSSRARRPANAREETTGHEARELSSLIDAS